MYNLFIFVHCKIYMIEKLLKDEKTFVTLERWKNICHILIFVKNEKNIIVYILQCWEECPPTHKLDKNGPTWKGLNHPGVENQWIGMSKKRFKDKPTNTIKETDSK